MIDPDVSEPRAYGTNPAATAIPEPLEDPPAQYNLFHGFNPGPCSDADAELYPPPPASSIIESLPINIACSLLSRLITSEL
jgi:hypothetical protein